MQIVHAGNQKLVLLELETEMIENILRQTGFDHSIRETSRRMTIELSATDRQGPLLLFDAAEPSNLGWFSRCQFYVDGVSGNVLQTPLTLGNVKDSSGRNIPHSIRLDISKELPTNFKMPGKQPISEQIVYSVLFNFLQALLNTGVGICGRPVVQPLTGKPQALPKIPTGSKSRKQIDPS